MSLESPSTLLAEACLKVTDHVVPGSGDVGSPHHVATEQSLVTIWYTVIRTALSSHSPPSVKSTAAGVFDCSPGDTN